MFTLSFPQRFSTATPSLLTIGPQTSILAHRLITPYPPWHSIATRPSLLLLHIRLGRNKYQVLKGVCACDLSWLCVRWVSVHSVPIDRSNQGINLLLPTLVLFKLPVLICAVQRSYPEIFSDVALILLSSTWRVAQCWDSTES